MADLLQGVQDAMADGSGNDPKDFKMPSTDELLAAIEKMTGLSEEQKKSLVDDILAGQALGDSPGIPKIPVETVAARSVSLEIVWVLAFFSIVLFVLDNSLKSLGWAVEPISLISFFPRMDDPNFLASSKILADMLVKQPAALKKRFLEKISNRIEEEKIKLLCTVLYSFLAGLFTFVFVFFGYKLYKSLVDRERRREEKRRQKLQKKKK